MSVNSFGRLLRVTTWGESHGPAIGAVVDGCPPGLTLNEADLQPWLDRRRPGTSRFTTQRQEPDLVRILSGTYEGRTTGTPIALQIDNVDQRSKDYAGIAQAYRPGHADYAYDAKYGRRDPRGGGRSSARETAMRVAAGGVARLVIPEVRIRAYLVELGGDRAGEQRRDAEAEGADAGDSGQLELQVRTRLLQCTDLVGGDDRRLAAVAGVVPHVRQDGIGLPHCIGMLILGFFDQLIELLVIDEHGDFLSVRPNG